MPRHFSDEVLKRNKVRHAARSKERARRVGIDEAFPRWTVGLTESLIKRLRALEVEEPKIECFLRHLHDVEGLDMTSKGAGWLARRSHVPPEVMLAAVERAWSVRPIEVVYAGLPSLGKASR